MSPALGTAAVGNWVALGTAGAGNCAGLEDGVVDVCAVSLAQALLLVMIGVKSGNGFCRGF